MALVNLYGNTAIVPIGQGTGSLTENSPATASTTVDAANEACIVVGRVQWTDEGSHTIDTTGSSSLGWVTGAVTFANAGTTVKIGLASVDLANGPPTRAANVADVITFDVNAAPVGGGGGISASTWNTSVPTAGTKTIAHGDLVAFAVQMTARAGADSVIVTHTTNLSTAHLPAVTGFTGGAYAAVQGSPSVILTASDGTLGFFQGGEVYKSFTTRTWNSGSATKEYGQLFKLPFPTKIYGFYGWLTLSADCDVVLYSDPLGTPIAEKTVSLDANVSQSANLRKMWDMFSSPYTTTADQTLAIVIKPGASNVGTTFKTLQSATHRVADPFGVQGYGVSRASGAFADANSGLDHYYIGILVGAFDVGGRTSRARTYGGMA